MLRVLVGLTLLCTTAAIAQPAPPTSARTPVAAAVAETPEAPQVTDVSETPEAQESSEAPKMKKVCRTYEVVGSAIGKTVCTMKPVKPSKKAN